MRLPNTNGAAATIFNLIKPPGENVSIVAVLERDKANVNKYPHRNLRFDAFKDLGSRLGRPRGSIHSEMFIQSEMCTQQIVNFRFQSLFYSLHGKVSEERPPRQTSLDDSLIYVFQKAMYIIYNGRLLANKFAKSF